MAWYDWLFSLGIVVLSVLVVLFVALQKGDDDGMSALTGSVSDNRRQNHANGLEGKLPMLTTVFGILLAVACIVVVIVGRVTA